MQLAIEKSTLYSLIQKVMPATSASGPLPTCSCIRINVNNGAIAMNATDGKGITILASGVCDVKAPGAVGTNAKALHDIVSNFPSGLITVKIAGNRLLLKGERAAVHVTTVPEEHFPTLPDYNLPFTPCHGFFEAIKKVDFATVADDTSRAWMSGVRMGDGRIAATDGHRLALVAFDHKFSEQVTIPADLLKRAQKAVGDKADVALGGNRAHFRGDSVIASVSLLDGSYPDYQRIIPQTAYQDVKVKRKVLLSALDLIKATADQKELTVTMACADGIMKLHSKSEGAEGVQEIPAEFKDQAKISVSIRYITDVVDKLNTDDVVFEFRTETTPLVIKEEGYVNVIMPRRPA